MTTPSNRLDVHARYSRDPLFRTMVDMMVQMIDRLEMTPTEVREAAMLACYRHEIYSTKHHFFFSEENNRP